MTKALQPDDLLAHYRVIRALGASGMGEVYLARDSTLDRLIFEFVTSPDAKNIYFTQGSNNRDIIKITGLVK